MTSPMGATPIATHRSGSSAAAASAASRYEATSAAAVPASWGTRTGADGVTAMAVKHATHGSPAGQPGAAAGCPDTTSPRASATVAATITTTATIRTNQPASPGRSVSPSTKTPSIDPTIGSLTVTRAARRPSIGPERRLLYSGGRDGHHCPWIELGGLQQRPDPVGQLVDDALGEHGEQAPQ